MLRILALSLGVFLATSTNAFAISDVDLANVCLQKGIEKVVDQAKSWGCVVDGKNVEVEGVDNREDNPQKYVWYQAKQPCNGQDRVIKIVRYYRGDCD